jgi:hypothetical protein
LASDGTDQQYIPPAELRKIEVGQIVVYRRWSFTLLMRRLWRLHLRLRWLRLHQVSVAALSSSMFVIVEVSDLLRINEREKVQGGARGSHSHRHPTVRRSRIPFVAFPPRASATGLDCQP